VRTFVAVMLALSLALPLYAGDSDAGDSADADAIKTLIWPDGTRYVGGVEDGKRSGKGTIFWQDGSRFVGTFKNDMRNGPGSMILHDGTVYNGYFKDDRLVEPPAGAPQPLPATHATPPPQLRIPGELPVTEITKEVKEQLVATIDLWAAAWSEKNVVQYLAYYSQDFDVPGRQSRNTWEALRRSRLMRPGYIRLKVTYQRFRIVAPNVAEVSFKQTYQSNLYSDETAKTLTLRKEGHDWKIIKERSG
jgi:hypothetical protein